MLGVIAGVFLLALVALTVLSHEGWVKDDDSHLCYWIPCTARKRAHNRELKMLEKAYELQRKERRCRSLAASYREDGDEMSAIVLDAEADDAERQARLSRSSMRAARMELRDIEYRELTGGE